MAVLRLLLHPLVLCGVLSLHLLLSLPFAAANTDAQLQSWNATGCDLGVGQPLIFRSLDSNGACNNVSYYVDMGEGDPVSLQIFCRQDSVQLLWFDGTYGCSGRQPLINQTWNTGATQPTACQSVYGSFSIKVVCDGWNGAASIGLGAAGMSIAAALMLLVTLASL